MEPLFEFLRMLWALVLRLFGLGEALPPSPPPEVVSPTDTPTAPPVTVTPNVPQVEDPPIMPPTSQNPKPPIVLTGDLSDGFFLGSVKTGQRLKTDPRAWFAVSAYEANHMHANATNPAGAWGMLQFTEPARERIGWPKDRPMSDIARLSAEDQLPLIEKYLSAGAPYKSAGEAYGEVFLPARMLARGRGEDVILTEDPEIYYTSNKSLDVNKDGKISIGDLTATTVNATHAMGARWKEVLARLAWAEKEVGETSSSYAVPVVIAGVALAFIVALSHRGA